jgi:intein/homing endonuclease/TolA-binding protein
MGDDDDETIRVGETSGGVAADAPAGNAVELPVVELMTGRGFVTGKSGGGKSILEGTPVYTESGRKPIEAVSQGEQVLSLNKHTYEQEFREVQATIEHTDDRLLRVTLEDGTELVGTEDHSFLTVDTMEVVPVRGEDLEEGMWMPLSRELPASGSVSEIDLGEYIDDANNIRMDGGVIQSGPRTEERHLDLDFPMGKEIGLYLAEGSFDSKHTLQISNVDEGVHGFLDSRDYNVYERTCNKGFRPYANFLMAEFGRGAGNKSIPNWVYDTPEEFRAGILSGYFDGDGTVEERTVAAMSKSEDLVRGLKELLGQFGISATIREKFTLYEDERRRYLRLRIDAFRIAWFADVVDLSVESKAEELRELAEAASDGDGYNSKDMIPGFGPVLNAAARNAGWTERESDNRSDGASIHNLTRKQKADRGTYNRLVDRLDIEGRAREYGRSDIQWKRVVDIETLDRERTVYDLDVEHNDNFLANGVFVHNSNTASVVIEKLLDRGLPVMIVDIDGEYYGLKEEYEILHVGADDECDLVVNEEHAGKLAELALEQNVPIILDVSSFLDESDARDLLTAVARNLFAKEKKLKQPFLLVVEEVHEYIPEGGGLDECGRMLIKAAKRGRKHGLGVVGVSQRPADVKKDFITQCDWLVWHRLTWENDTKVVRRILGSEYADAIEGMGDGEAFVLTDWSERVRRVQFDRKETFDAGATPGLDDFERPELKSVSSDLVQDLEAISEAEERRESRIQELERQLADREERIEELEAELAEAKDLSKMAERFSRAMMEHASGRAFRADLTEGVQTEMDDWRKRAVRGEHMEATRRPANPPADYDEGESGEDGDTGTEDGTPPGDPETETSPPAGWPETDDEAPPDGQAGAQDASSDAVDIDAAFEALGGPDGGTPQREGDEARDETTVDPVSGDSAGGTGTDARAQDGTATTEDGERDLPGGSAAGGWPEFADEESSAGEQADSDDSSTVERVVAESDPGFEREVVRDLKATIRGFDAVTRRMLAHYRGRGPDDPVEAHVAAGGDGDRTRAYSRNRTLRQADLVAHAGRGRYGYRLPARVQAAHDDRLDEAELADAVEAVERAFVTDDDATQADDSPDEDDRDEADADAAPEDADAEFIDADAVRDDDEQDSDVPPLTGVGGTAGSSDRENPASDDEAGTSVADAASGGDQFRPSEERPASDGGEPDEFPKWPGE